MESNIQKYKDEIERLVAQGSQLHAAMRLAFTEDKFRSALKMVLKNDKEVSEYLNSLPSFVGDYQTWYSEALVLLKQLLPDRVRDFVKLYERPKAARKEITFENYVIEDALQGLGVRNSFHAESNVFQDAAIPKMEQQVSILASVKRRFESHLFDIRQLVQADIFDSEIEASKELRNKGFIRAAGAVAGVVLESHLIQVCVNHRLVIRKKKPGINDLAQALKDHDVIDTPGWRKIQHLADLRNLCDHKSQREPTPEDIEHLINGVSITIKTLF